MPGYECKFIKNNSFFTHNNIYIQCTFLMAVQRIFREILADFEFQSKLTMPGHECKFIKKITVISRKTLYPPLKTLYPPLKTLYPPLKTRKKSKKCHIFALPPRFWSNFVFSTPPPPRFWSNFVFLTPPFSSVKKHRTIYRILRLNFNQRKSKFPL